MNQAQAAELFRALNKTAKFGATSWWVQCLSPTHNDRKPSCQVNAKYPHHFSCKSCGFSGTLNQIAIDAGFDVDSSINLQFNNKPIQLPDLAKLRLEPWTGSYRGINEATWIQYGALKWYDTFIDKETLEERLSAIRILLPIWQNGLLVSYTGRRIDDEVYMKYNNYEFAPAHQILYLYDFLQPTNPIALVEGPLDAIRYTLNGIPAVAILGAKNWSDYKLKLILQKAPSTVWLSMDNDTAGNDAMKALYAKLRRFLDVQLIELPPGNDPFDLIPESLAEIYQAVWARHASKVLVRG